MAFIEGMRGRLISDETHSTAGSGTSSTSISFQRALNGDEALFEFNFADAVHRRELQHCTDQQPGLLGVHIAGTFATDQQVEGDFLARGSNSACGVIGQGTGQTIIANQVKRIGTT
jgi:hypothetical protein